MLMFFLREYVMVCRVPSLMMFFLLSVMNNIECKIDGAYYK